MGVERVGVDARTPRGREPWGGLVTRGAVAILVYPVVWTLCFVAFALLSGDVDPANRALEPAVARLRARRRCWSRPPAADGAPAGPRVQPDGPAGPHGDRDAAGP